MATQTEIQNGAQTATRTDMEHQWLPFTPNRDFLADPRLFARAQGLYYYSPEGKPILDGSSGLFTTPAGHARVEIADAVRNQILELDFTSSFLRSHFLSSSRNQPDLASLKRMANGAGTNGSFASVWIRALVPSSS
jgi:adenosylmethionine-8-amino-7-oxononanoate aminotransferase